MDNKNNLEKHFAASALIFNEEGRVLLVNHKKLGVWLYPGGHVNSEETPDETVIREVKEETCLDVEIVGEKKEELTHKETGVSVLHNPYLILCEKIPGEKEHYHIDLIYLCKIINNNLDNLACNREESDGIKFFNLEELKEINLFPNFRRLLETLLTKEDK